MKAEERDNLLIRLDEKSESIMRELQSLNEHQVIQNGSIEKLFNRTTRNTTWIIAFKWIVGIGASILAVILTHLYGMW